MYDTQINMMDCVGLSVHVIMPWNWSYDELGVEIVMDLELCWYQTLRPRPKIMATQWHRRYIHYTVIQGT